MLIVQKFGGTSVADGKCIMNVASRIADNIAAGHKVVVVLSAQGHTTDELLAKAKELDPQANKREMDMLLSTGEQQSVALMAIALLKLGYPAISLTAAQVGIHSTSAYGNARIKRIDTERILAELDRNNVVLIAGFQGVNRYGDTTTLGRGASDTTAAAIAAVIHADLCEIYSDVEGVYTADPRIVKNAIKINEITYDEMLELASSGVQVLHNRSVEMAKRYRVNFVVRSSFSRNEGTLVKEEVTKVESTYVSGIAVDDDIARITVVGFPNQPGMNYKILSQLSKAKIPVDIILQCLGRSNLQDMSFTIRREDLQQSMELLQSQQDLISFERLSYNDNVAKLSVVGAGMAHNSGVASLMFEALYECGVNIDMVSTSEIKISVLIDKKFKDVAMQTVHDKFFAGLDR